MSPKILDENGTQIKGMASFTYKNHTITFTTLANHPEVMIFGHDGSVCNSVGSVEKAIEDIDLLAKHVRITKTVDKV